MSSRSRAAANLAHHLNSKVDAQLRVDWDNSSRRPGRGAWRVTWTDGPTVETMRDHAENLVRYCRPLTIDMLHFSRHTTRQTWVAAMLTLAHRGDLPERPALALAAAEHELTDTDTADWHHLTDHARQLIEQADEDLYQIVALIHATVTKPHNETSLDTGACQRCAAPLATTRTGRPARYCGPLCRQAAHRARATVTKPRHETRCATCSSAFTPTGAGRPARHCSPACRTRAWRHAKGRSR
jgi:hypothetical protein